MTGIGGAISDGSICDCQESSDHKSSASFDPGRADRHNGLGAVLMQKQPDGNLHPVAYTSRSMSAME